MTQWLKAKPKTRVEDYPFERPLLHAFSGHDWFLGDVRLDLEEKADVKGDGRSLPFKDDSFAAVFADVPWTSGFKSEIATVMKEFLRVAPVAYLLSPWVYGSSICRLDWVMVSWRPGVNQPLLFARYMRNGP